MKAVILALVLANERAVLPYEDMPDYLRPQYAQYNNTPSDGFDINDYVKPLQDLPLRWKLTVDPLGLLTVFCGKWD